jgi:hypothetical protein
MKPKQSYGKRDWAELVGETVGGACCEKPHKSNIPYVDLTKGKKPNPKPCMQQERLSQNLWEIVQAIRKVEIEEQ